MGEEHLARHCLIFGFGKKNYTPELICGPFSATISKQQLKTSGAVSRSWLRPSLARPAIDFPLSRSSREPDGCHLPIATELAPALPGGQARGDLS